MPCWVRYQDQPRDGVTFRSRREVGASGNEARREFLLKVVWRGGETGLCDGVFLMP
jgi:hypothetical protein